MGDLDLHNLRMRRLPGIDSPHKEPTHRPLGIASPGNSTWHKCSRSVLNVKSIARINNTTVANHFLQMHPCDCAEKHVLLNIILLLIYCSFPCCRQGL